MRSLAPNEQALIEAIANALPEAQRRLVKADLERSKVDEVTRDGSRLLFVIEGYERPIGTGQHPYPVEGTMLDSDGADLYVILYADRNGRLFELEIIRWADGSVIKPNLASLATF